MLTSGKNPDTEGVSLYFHIPFCTKKCAYCHFYVLPDKDPFHKLLLEGLLIDIDRWGPLLTHKRLESIYFGGGTPALIGAQPLFRLLEHVRKYLNFDKNNIEITLEANPETITQSLMQDYAAAGVNRVSIGIQSLDDALLKKLGRTHSASAAIEAVETTARAGIDNISIDLMYDVPCQTLASWKHTLSQASSLPVSHLSLYNLTIEPHTVFFKYRESLQKELPDADCSAQMYRSAIEILGQAGLKQYEISAFARNQRMSHHNIGYWTGRPFIGFGPSAFSYWDGRRFRAVAHLHKYVEALRENHSPEDFSEKLPSEKQQRELLAIALRLCEGVDLKEFQSRHGSLDTDLVRTLHQLRDQELITWKKDPETILLTQKGRLFYDTVASEIV
jgi:oxygen-independent coproporphyrinogen III oxidase